MKKLLSFIVTTVVTAIGFSFWKAWNSKNERETKLEEDMDFEDDIEDFIGEPSPIIDILEEETPDDIEVIPEIAEREDEMPSRGLGEEDFGDFEEIPEPPAMEEDDLDDFEEIPEPSAMEEDDLDDFEEIPEPSAMEEDDIDDFEEIPEPSAMEEEEGMEGFEEIPEPSAMEEEEPEAAEMEEDNSDLSDWGGEGTPPIGGEEEASEEESRETFAWQIGDFEVHKMWTDAKGAKVKVAILDSGILHTHSDLETVDCKDFVGEAGDATDTDGHGTHCAGIIAAKGVGEVRGIAPEAELYVAKIAESDFDVTNERILKALRWAVKEVKADIVTMSFSLHRQSDEIEQLLNRYKDTVLFVGACSRYRYPASYQGCMGVADIDVDLKASADFARYKAVKIAAPGIDINSTFTDPLYKTDSGSSMATAYVSGIFALLKSFAIEHDLSLDSQAYTDLLEETAVPAGDFKIINPLGALKQLKGKMIV
ncbi:MAG: S8 family serine peptidase [Chitinophagales bacterium]